MQVDFDPARVTYAQLLDFFFGFHNVCAPSHSTQYKGAIFAHDAEQRRLAEELLAQQSARRGQPAKTDVLDASLFYLAEDYHQKYALRQYRDIASELTQAYPKLRDFIDSTAATRLNAFAHGYGTLELLAAEIDGYGLSAAAQAQLRELVR